MERETYFLLHNPLNFFKNEFSGEFYFIFKDFIDLEFFNKDGLFYSNNNKKVIKKKAVT